ncbi:hypothetical protein [Enhygromyxa salina]|uniref:Uncharacterized protein n=1 Tax=Enhygromyxa salina TaxID=215803 RepID=A0A2S9YIX9_9BACT|nr:hypothetical protein [Enhygromyxa salina]PRQ05067.1 hypothetical protein ENSA7_48200 [Enhygromyxa salina]
MSEFLGQDHTTQKTIDEAVAKADPQYIEVAVSARNETGGLANLGTAARLTVLTDGGHDFTVKMTLVDDDASVSPEAFRNLTYRSAPWDKLSPTETATIEMWWNSGKLAVLSLEDNTAEQIESGQFLFADPPGDDIRVRAISPVAAFWAEWKDWLRIVIVLALLAIFVLLVQAMRHVAMRRTSLAKVLWSGPDTEDPHNPPRE